MNIDTTGTLEKTDNRLHALRILNMRHAIYVDPAGEKHYWQLYGINGHTFYIKSTYTDLDENGNPRPDQITDFDLDTLAEDNFQFVLDVFGYKDVESIDISKFTSSELLNDTKILPLMSEFTEAFALVDFTNISPNIFMRIFPHIDNINSYIFNAEKDKRKEFVENLIRSPITRAFDEILMRFMIAIETKLYDPEFEFFFNDTYLNQLEANSVALSKRLHRYPLIITRT